MILHPGVKINLGLNLLRKRPDGFHDLETLFVPVDNVHDTLEIVRGDDWSLTADHIRKAYTPDQRVQAISPDGKVMVTIARKEGVDWDPLKDLTVKAYNILAADFDLPPVKIFLEKGSPVGAGLGGGSADAAFALRAIAELAGLVSSSTDSPALSEAPAALSDADLAAYAARLGSDCAFFIYNRPMFASGRGEVLEDFPLPIDFRVELVIPDGISVSTAEAYSAVTPHLPPVPLRKLLAAPARWRAELHNDFEDSVFPRHPQLPALKDALYARGAFYASMSGSGSALFGLFR